MVACRAWASSGGSGEPDSAIAEPSAVPYFWASTSDAAIAAIERNRKPERIASGMPEAKGITSG